MCLFFRRAGLTFSQWQDKLLQVPGWTVGPAGAPLGEEVTRHSSFEEQHFTLYYELNGMRERCYGSIQTRKLSIWNPSGDSLIHSFGISLQGVEFCPALNPFYWGENPALARLLYRQAKQFFEVFDCDEMVGSSDHYEGAFQFIRGAPEQRVLTYAEENRMPTQQEIQDDTWYAWWPTDRVFHK